MRIFIDKLILFIGCFLFLLYCYPDIGTSHVMAFLFAFIFLCLCTYCNPDLMPFHTLAPSTLITQLVLSLLFLMAGLTNPVFFLFLPLVFYELTENRIWELCLILCFIFCIFRFQKYPHVLAFMTLFVLAFLLKDKTQRLLELERDFKRLRDNSTEYNLLLQQKNQDLIHKQDYELYAATLKERNRIAREIHDNVGHMLSRSILQAGALLAINKDPALTEPLTALKDTLSLAMNSVRESVHDLHDDSIDLEASLHTMIHDFTDYDVQITYDMGKIIPRNIKYCFIAIAKEALSNISRHSNATRIQITVREHPAFYQFIIEDNGTDISIKGNGIGLENMKERVEQLHGRLSISAEQGFRIFISIPKNSVPNTLHESGGIY